jgi:hypothetical protein
MLEKRNISRDSETDPCVQLANGLVVLAEKELSAFISAVDKLFGAEQARQSALDWIEELELMDWPTRINEVKRLNEKRRSIWKQTTSWHELLKIRGNLPNGRSATAGSVREVSAVVEGIMISSATPLSRFGTQDACPRCISLLRQFSRVCSK